MSEKPGELQNKVKALRAGHEYAKDHMVALEEDAKKSGNPEAFMFAYITSLMGATMLLHGEDFIVSTMCALDEFLPFLADKRDVQFGSKQEVN
jgi:hypothetical protein